MDLTLFTVHLAGHGQCGNLKIFPFTQIYLKSISGILADEKNEIRNNFGGGEFCF